MPAMEGALDGFRILEFSQGVAGPMACMLLADLGAEVIKLEPPGSDRERAQPGYLCWSRNKRAIELDLERESGLDAARSLLATADVAVFDGSADRLERLGLDAESLTGRDSTLLHVHLPHYGVPGWWSELPVDDSLLWGMSGAAFSQFSWEDVPVQLVTPVLSYAQAVLAAGAIASGLYERARSGEGQALTVSGLHALSGIQSGAVPRSGTFALPRPRGARGPIPNYRLYRCADGKSLFLGTLMPHHFSKALEALDLAEILEMEGIDGEFMNVLKPENVDEVGARLDRRFGERACAEWLDILRESDVPAGAVGIREEWFASETVAANRMRVVLPHPELGPVELPGVPLKLSETPGEVRHVLQRASLEELLSDRPERASAVAERRAASPSGGPLAGVRVLDLGAIIAAPFASALLASLGADVIKVEPVTGDSFRTYGPGFLGYNQGKRSIALDLKHPDGLETFYALVRHSDVVCDNYRLGVLERLRIDYEALRALNPRIIQVSITAYGSSGALAEDPGFDPLLQAQSGLMAAQGGADEPVFHQIPVNDVASAMVAALGVAAALLARERTGRGQRVETSLASQSVLFQSAELTRYAGRPPSPEGGRDCVGLGALRRFYACADGWLALSCSERHQFEALCTVLGHPEWAAAQPPERALEEAWDGPLAATLSDAFKRAKRDELIERLRESGVPAAPAARADELSESPLHTANRFFQELDHPLFGPLKGVRGFADYSRTTAGFSLRPPLLGEHGEALLAELGTSHERISHLVRDGVTVFPSD
jgi:crotonobetainyl-CoA:carnitine CoA-transferase CaiB-like acyl-CoA transferase